MYNLATLYPSVSVVPSSVTRNIYTFNTSKGNKTSSRTPSRGISSYQTRSSKHIQPYPPTKYSGIVLHQTAAQRRYLLGNITSVSLNATNGIFKATASKQSSNWYRWCIFLTHSGIKEKKFNPTSLAQRSTWNYSHRM